MIYQSYQCSTAWSSLTSDISDDNINSGQFSYWWMLWSGGVGTVSYSYRVDDYEPEMSNEKLSQDAPMWY